LGNTNKKEEKMEACSEKTIKIQLNMNENEARWLMSHMQNWMGGNEFNESKKEKAMREDLFSILRLELGDQ